MEEEQEELLMIVGLALPGVVMKSSILDTPKDIARKAFEIADAVIIEKQRREKLTKTQENESIH